jgi:hypothetical protein
MSETKERAAKLLAEYDTIKSRLWVLDQELNKACADYGRELNLWGFGPTHLRMRLRMERERDLHGSTSSPPLA